MLGLEVAKVSAANTLRLVKDATSCDMIPKTLPFHIPNPAMLVCEITRLITLNILVLTVISVEIAFITTKHALMMKVIGAGKVYDDYYYESPSLYCFVV